MDPQPIYNDSTGYIPSDPEEDGSSQKRRMVFLVAGVGLLIILLIGGLIYLFSMRSRQTAIQEAVSQVTQTDCAGAFDVDACVGRKQAEVIGAQGNVKACNALEGDAKDACVWEAAQSKKDPGTCEALSTEESKTICKDLLFLDIALKELQPDVCASVSNESRRTTCESYFFTGITPAQCRSLNRPADVCVGLDQKAAAIAARNPDLCQSISLELIRVDCLDYIGSGDRDHDGLDAETEAFYGSSDEKIDSDADGYSDAEEIKAGYSPVGPGKL